MKSLFISVHYDDAVFSCGRLISIMEHATVLTIFGGVPQNKGVCTAYDQKSGFENAEQAILTRRDEDATALSVLGAKQLYMDVPENQYDESRDLKGIRREIEAMLDEYDEVYLPIGLLHPDHEAVGNITRGIYRKIKKCYVFMDQPYYVDNPEVAVDKLHSYNDLSYSYRGGDLGKKMIAASCYRSQFKITNIYHLMADERYYEITS